MAWAWNFLVISIAHTVVWERPWKKCFKWTRSFHPLTLGTASTRTNGSLSPISSIGVREQETVRKTALPAPHSVTSSTSTRFTCLTALTARTSRSALPELTANGRMLHLISNLYAEKSPKKFTQHSCNKSPTPPKRLYCKNIESSNYSSLRIDCQFGPAHCLTHEDTLASKVLAVCAVNTKSRFSGKLTRLTRF